MYGHLTLLPPHAFADTLLPFLLPLPSSALLSQPAKRQKALYALTSHPGFRPSHPREEHFVPLYIAAGAADKAGGRTRVLFGAHGAKTLLFGV